MFARGAGRLRKLTQPYAGRLHVLHVYIREAHPVDGWSFSGFFARRIVRLVWPSVGLDHADPKTLEERRLLAEKSVSALQHEFFTVVDDVDDAVATAYAAKPTRLYLLGAAGHVLYAGGLGPAGFKPSELAHELEQTLLPATAHAG